MPVPPSCEPCTVGDPPPQPASASAAAAAPALAVAMMRRRRGLNASTRPIVRSLSQAALSVADGSGMKRRASIPAMPWHVYLSGEIHSDWRARIANQIFEEELDVELSAPVTDHASSDDCGVAILGEQPTSFWKDHVGAGLNAIRTRTLIEQSDVIVVRFGDQYRQWNAAFDAGYAAALGKPLIVLHPEEHDHALKEVDRAALAVAREPEQVVDILRYVLNGTLPRR